MLSTDHVPEMPAPIAAAVERAKRKSADPHQKLANAMAEAQADVLYRTVDAFLKARGIDRGQCELITPEPGSTSLRYNGEVLVSWRTPSYSRLSDGSVLCMFSVKAGPGA